ncbi:unnamed protein product [Aphanomyces euteiches]|uniref:FAD dependent oxidoreductase domain-containing protein n=1 Tax=Aphanomyces euteiches TaxID=100861 RepID=A0A6G0XVA5_9STRA|nr:hypothetical protein Ae201684_000902 [Aphanomyces euteiches]KAH9099998.1 hypothetical protein Ae201684P_019003 [Aphanomyces euteiches]KAH9141517.1 hypothetical protein AeRB84_014297 [Aphanomyces euteiches]
MAEFDVIVLGVGGMGSSACQNLAKRGLSVLGIEQFDMAHGLGSSHGKSRMIRKAYHEHPDYVPLLRRSYDLWDDLEHHTGDKLFHRTGVLYVGHNTTSESLQGVELSASQHDIPIEPLSPEDFHSRFPQFKLPQDYRAIFEPDAGFINVEGAVTAFCKEAQRLGATLHFNERVERWTSDGTSVTVHTSRGVYRAAKLIITAGAWSSQFLQLQEKDVFPLTVNKVSLFWFNSPQPEKLTDMPCYGFEMPYGFVYGFPFNAQDGIKVAIHLPGENVADPSNLDRTVPPEELASVAQCVRECMPYVDASTTKDSAACMYTMSADGHFVLDLHPDYSNVAFAAGFSGHGFKFCPVIGEVLTDLVTTGTTEHPIGFLRRR